VVLIVPPAQVGEGEIRLRAARITLRGLPLLGRSSTLPFALRALVLGGSAAVMAIAASALVLVASIRSRALALALRAVGAASALSTFSNLEQVASGPLVYLAVPISGVMAMAATAWFARLLRTPLRAHSPSKKG